jgi:two-component system, NarL family, nitrate/nitrite response regulator NarL
MRERARLAAGELGISLVPGRAASRGRSLNARAKLLRVLIADDHRLTRDEVCRAIGAEETFDICAVVGRRRPRCRGRGVGDCSEVAGRENLMLIVSDEDAGLSAALRAGADGYLLKTMNLERLPDALVGVYSGEAATQESIARTRQ